MAESTPTTLLGFLLIWGHLGEFQSFLKNTFNKSMECYEQFFFTFLIIRLHGVCEENPLAPIIGRLGLPLYRTSGDDSVLFDHDLER